MSDGSFESWSATLPGLIGLDDERMPRSTRAWMALVHPDERELFRAKAIDAGRRNERVEVEYRLRRPDATWAHMLQFMEPIAAGDAADGPARWFSTLQDVTERKLVEHEVRRLNADLERRVAERTAELEAANRELEAFNYSVSHDLRAPLNRIRGFSAMLLEENATTLGERSRDFLRRIGTAGQDMDGLIGDLLDLSMVAAGELQQLDPNRPAPMGPTRMLLSKPVIAAVEGYAVAGGLELALWCDLRVAASDAVFGVFNRRFGVPLVDLGTIRLPRLIGHSVAMDLILTGRRVNAVEAKGLGLVNRLTPKGEALNAAVALARELAAFPQIAMRNDRMAAIQQWFMSEREAMESEVRYGLATFASGEPLEGAKRFVSGDGRHGV